MGKHTKFSCQKITSYTITRFKRRLNESAIRSSIPTGQVAKSWATECSATNRRSRSARIPMKKAIALFLLVVCFSIGTSADADDEVTLFDGRGKAVAYIAFEDDFTIYLWSGKPVAYLDRDSSGGFHVYGFNGEHLGWFVSGVVWDHEGNASCAVEEKMKSTEFEPFKSFKQFKPFKSFKKFAPFRPAFSKSFGDTPCRFLLAEGGK